MQVGQRPLSPLARQFFEAAAAVGEALRPQLTDIRESLRHGFMLPGDLRRAVPVGVSLQPLADVLRKRPVSSEETTT
jgi:hypothetical protein